MIVQRFEKGQKFLDLHKWANYTRDDDGLPIEEECWQIAIWENGDNADAHKVIDFGSEFMARMYITENDWKEQVL